MTPAERLTLAARINQEIDTYCATAYNDGHRSHLGASIIGKECDMQLWAGFRWLAPSKAGGRLRRLWNRGHREEERFVEWLRGIGFTVWEVDENGKQFRVSGVDGHFGGSCDGIAKGPDWFSEVYGNMPILLEFKTKGTGSGFNKLCAEGMKKVHPEHFSQNSIYGGKLDIPYVLYLSINKNDDTIHVEIEELEFAECERKEARARDIIYAKTPPRRVSANATFWLCKNCDFSEVCHHSAKPETNCRSCKNAEPIENAEWRCNFHGSVIPKEFLPVGCDQWESII